MRYVLGFMFSPDGKRVALLTKKPGSPQENKLNGIGGKVEPAKDESLVAAQVREFREETGVETSWAFWREVGTFQGEGYEVTVFSGRVQTPELPELVSPPDGEPVGWHATDMVQYLALRGAPEVASNLAWLLPLALDPNVAGASVRLHD